MAGLESSRWSTSSQRGIFASTQVYPLLDNCFGDPCANGFSLWSSLLPHSMYTDAFCSILQLNGFLFLLNVVSRLAD
jgi:hypothetical protein